MRIVYKMIRYKSIIEDFKRRLLLIDKTYCMHVCVFMYEIRVFIMNV